MVSQTLVSVPKHVVEHQVTMSVCALEVQVLGTNLGFSGVSR